MQLTESSWNDVEIDSFLLPAQVSCAVLPLAPTPVMPFHNVCLPSFTHGTKSTVFAL